MIALYNDTKHDRVCQSVTKTMLRTFQMPLVCLIVLRGKFIFIMFTSDKAILNIVFNVENVRFDRFPHSISVFQKGQDTLLQISSYS